MLHRWSKGTRRGVLALTAALLMTAAAAPSASAVWSQTYCANNVAAPYPYYLCESSGLHSLYYNEVWTTSYSQYVCQYMWNAHNAVVRGNYVGCAYGITNRTWSRTSDAWYNAKGYNAMSYSILLSAYTTTG